MGKVKEIIGEGLLSVICFIFPWFPLVFFFVLILLVLRDNGQFYLFDTMSPILMIPLTILFAIWGVSWGIYAAIMFDKDVSKK